MKSTLGGGNSLTIDYATETLKAEGTVDIGVFGFFYVSGNFAFEKSSLTDVALSGGGNVASLEVLTVGASDVDAFAGVNGPADSGSAMGLSLQDVDFALVLGKVKAPAAPAVATDLRTFTAVTGDSRRCELHRHRRFDPVGHEPERRYQ